VKPSRWTAIGLSLGALAAWTAAGAVGGRAASYPYPPYVREAAMRYLSQASLTSQGTLTLGDFAVLLRRAASLTGSPTTPYPSHVTGSGPQAQALGLAVEEGYLPNAPANTPVSSSVAQKAVGALIGLGTYGALPPADLPAALESVGVVPPAPPTAILTPWQAATFLAQAFSTDPQALATLAKLNRAASSIQSLVDTITLTGSMPPRSTGPIQGGTFPGALSSSAPAGSLTFGGTVTVLEQTHPQLAVETQTHLTISYGGHVQSQRTVDILTTQGGYVKMFRGQVGTWYRLPPGEVPNLQVLASSGGDVGLMASRTSALLHPRLLPGAQGTFRIAWSAHLASLAPLLSALPPSVASGTESSFSLAQTLAQRLGVCGVTAYSRRTLWPISSSLHLAAAFAASAQGQRVPFAGLEESLQMVPQVNVPVHIVVPPQAQTAPYLPTQPPPARNPGPAGG
jgi:hypothetical protein